MVRKTVTTLLMLALVLIGFQAVSAPTVSSMVVAMDHEQSCCPDCDQPKVPGRDCTTMAGCIAAPSWTVLASVSVPVYYMTGLDHSIPDDTSVHIADVAPPFRPPRS